ncbi:hypothetical protein [Corynebacterium sp.]|uniref:hypothetical protein n=1 Tax=Corynebacterium sp. TaxID=1720 RepID=UPI0026DD4773|nr:hypothetical protein [Corynebacterium sp.]MDO5077186.1 hypothetical protein [Corynebacterium sp.]
MTYVDVTSPLRAMAMPVVEMLAFTAAFWMLVGFLDRDFYPWRNLVVLVWALCVLWRFVLPLLKQRRRRLTVTDTEIRVRNPGLFSRTMTIPMRVVRGAGRHRDMLTLHTQAGPVYVTGVPKAKRIADTINQLSYS